MTTSHRQPHLNGWGPADAAVEGFRLGPYRLGRRLDVDDRGVLFAGRNACSDRAVTIRLLNPDFAAAGASTALDIRRAVALRQPSLPTTGIYRIGCDSLLYVNECDAAHALAARPGAVPPSALARLFGVAGASDRATRALRIADRVAEACAFAHAHGIVHGWIQPSNVYVEPDGRVLLGDLGLRMVAAWRPLGRGLAYTAPEVVRSPKHVDPRVDVYGVALLLVEQLVGSNPFRHPTAERTLSAVLAGEPLPLLEWRAVPRGLRPLLRRSLAVDPAERPQTMRAFREELQHRSGVAGQRLGA